MTIVRAEGQNLTHILQVTPLNGTFCRRDRIKPDDLAQPLNNGDAPSSLPSNFGRKIDQRLVQREMLHICARERVEINKVQRDAKIKEGKKYYMGVITLPPH